MEGMMNDPLKPSAALLVKLGSLVVHLEEAYSLNGHEFEHISFRALQNDPDVREWFTAMNKMALLPVKRNP
jgi:hypothetical protein